MNATIWPTLADFVKYLGRTGACRIAETERGWTVAYIERDPETLGDWVSEGVPEPLGVANPLGLVVPLRVCVSLEVLLPLSVTVPLRVPVAESVGAALPLNEGVPADAPPLTEEQKTELIAQNEQRLSELKALREIRDIRDKICQLAPCVGG
jgi:hypothetical protein